MSKIAFIFPGQGAQKAGMGKGFYDTYEEAKELYELASKWLDLDMKQLCFEENEQLHQTEYTQCALVTTSLAMMRVLLNRGIKPDVAAGLSLGEYCALVAAGIMSEEDAIKLVRKRGIFMEHEVPNGVGAMAAVLGMEAEQIDAVLSSLEDSFKEDVQIANYNCPGQIVISGKKEAVDKACALLKEKGARRCLPLNVSGPFHSNLLVGAGEKLRNELEHISLNKQMIPYTTNVTGNYVTNISGSDETGVSVKKLLTEQVYSSVRWQQCMETMIADGVDTFIEIGPGKTLTGFLKKIDKSVTTYNIETPQDLDAIVEKINQ